MAVFVTPKRIYWFHLIRYGQKIILNTNYGKFTPENNMEIQIFRNNSNQHQTSQTNSKFEVSLDRLISILVSSLIQLLPFRIAPASTKWNDEKKTQLYCVNTSRWNAVLTGAVPNNFLLFRCVIFSCPTNSSSSSFHSLFPKHSEIYRMGKRNKKVCAPLRIICHSL